MKSILFFIAVLGSVFLQGPPLEASESNRILYLLHTGEVCRALDLYQEQRSDAGEHDLEIIQQIGLILLDNGYRCSDPEVQLLTLFGSGISLNDRAQYILKEGIKSCNPQFQLIAMNFLSKFENEDANEMINRAMSSDSLGIRLEAAYHLAQMKHQKASGQIESLMQKVVPEIWPLFPQLLAMSGDADSIKILQKLLTNPYSAVRIEAINAAAKYDRDDLLPDIRRLSTHLNVAQQEACAVALGVLKDENSIAQLETLAQAKTASVRLAALQALYRLGRENVYEDIEVLANNGDLFAITVLGEIPGSEPVLLNLVKMKNLPIRINAALALLELRDPKCLPALCGILIKDSRDLAFSNQKTYGKGLSAWKVIPSARQNLQKETVSLELSLHMREGVLEKTLELPEEDFLRLAHALFEVRQNDLVPLLVQLLENLQTPKAISLLKHHREQIGAPLIRNYCNLALYRLKEPGPYKAEMREWMTSKQCCDLIQFRPVIPWEIHNSEPSKYQLTPEETSRLLVESFETLVQTQDDLAIDILLHAIQYGNPKNRYALAGLLLRAAN